MRYTARGRLPNSDLGALLAAIAEFIAHHRKVDQHMFDLDEDERAPPAAAGEWAEGARSRSTGRWRRAPGPAVA